MLNIEAMTIEEIKANFFDLMNTVVTTYGDDQDETTEQQQIAQQQAEGESHAE